MPTAPPSRLPRVRPIFLALLVVPGLLAYVLSGCVGAAVGSATARASTCSEPVDVVVRYESTLTVGTAYTPAFGNNVSGSVTMAESYASCAPPNDAGASACVAGRCVFTATWVSWECKSLFTTFPVSTCTHRMLSGGVAVLEMAAPVVAMASSYPVSDPHGTFHYTFTRAGAVVYEATGSLTGTKGGY